jgi:hypothetical protein
VLITACVFALRFDTNPYAVPAKEFANQKPDFCRHRLAQKSFENRDIVLETPKATLEPVCDS